MSHPTTAQLQEELQTLRNRLQVLEQELARRTGSEDRAPLRDLASDQAQALRQCQDKLAQVGRHLVLSDLALHLAHELNQPLSAIVGYIRGCTRRLREGSGTRDELLHALDQAAGQAAQAAETLRRLRTFLRHDPPHEESDVNEVIREALALADAGLRAVGVQPRAVLTPGLPHVLVNPVQIEQVVLNLIRNALDAMALTPAAERQLVIGTTPHPEGVEVFVSDTGSGISSEHRRQLFTPFFTTKPLGLGLGLTISRSLVEAHGGRLWLTPEDGPGARFHFTLPVGKRGHSHDG